MLALFSTKYELRVGMQGKVPLTSLKIYSQILNGEFS